MQKKAYHHGNLKHEMIEAGLAYISEHGVSDLSMRKLAEICGVSSAAPYAHFENKQAYLEAVQAHITLLFTEELEHSVKNCKDEKKIFIDLGVSYVLFFKMNPLYYSFLFTYGKIDVKTYPPYVFFSDISRQVLSAMHIDEEGIRNKTLAMWSMVQGLSGLSLMDGVLNQRSIKKEIEAILGSVSIS